MSGPRWRGLAYVTPLTRGMFRAATQTESMVCNAPCIFGVYDEEEDEGRGEEWREGTDGLREKDWEEGCCKKDK